MILDIMRAQNKDGALIALLKDLCERANTLMIDETDALRILKSRLQHVSERIMAFMHKGEQDSSLYLEPVARKYAFLTSMCAMAAWSLQKLNPL